MRTSSDRPLLPLVAGIAVLLFSPGCASTPAGRPVQPELRAHLLIYSGRPNPSFVLEAEAEVAELRELVGALESNPDFQRDTVVPSILGYAGVTVVNGAGIEGLPSYLAVYRGDAELTNGSRSFRRDPDRRLEDWLIERFVERKLVDDRALELIRGR